MSMPMISRSITDIAKLSPYAGGGMSFSGANGKMSNLNKKLEQGDIVEILTSKNQTPKKSWLEKIFTPNARHKLLHTLNDPSKSSSNEKPIPPIRHK